MEKEIGNQLSKRIDLLHTIQITLFFVLIMVIYSFEMTNSPINIFLVFIIMLGTIIGYYTNLVFAIIYSIVFNFLFASVNIYFNLSQAQPIEVDVYFWMVSVPLFAIAYAFTGNLIKDIQEENIKLKADNKELVTIDKDTLLKSSRSFFDELQSYINISKRYDIELYLVLISIKYEKEVLNILGEVKFNLILKKLSSSLDKALRAEDRKFILRKMNMFGVILLSNKDGGNHVKNRLRETMESVDYREDLIMNRIRLDMRFGVAEFDQNTIESALDLFAAAQKDMEFDV